MRHHPRVVAQHAGLVPDGRGGKCQGVWRGGRGDRESAERGGLGGEETEKTELHLDSKSFIVMGWHMGLLLGKPAAFDRQITQLAAGSNTP